MKLALSPRPPAAHVHAMAAFSLAAAVVRPAPKRPPSTDNPRAAGRATAPASLAAYLAVTALNVPQAAVARAMGRAPSTVCKALRAVEDRRDEPEFDAALAAAEQEMCPA